MLKLFLSNPARCLVFFWLCVFTGQGAFAQSSASYYRATVPVKSQDARERSRAASEAMAQVLQRMSGLQDVASAPEIARTLPQAVSYIEQYHYLALNDPDWVSAGFREQITVNFAPEVIRNLLARAQLPFWPDKRPATLVWLVEDSAEQGKQLLNRASSHALVASLQQAAQVRGLPLVFPLLDMDDRLAINPQDVWTVNEERINAASARYKTDVILVGRFSQTSRGEILAIWQYFHAGASASYDSRVDASSPQENARLGAEALFPLADFLAARYALQPKTEAADQIVLQLSGVKNYAAYRRALSYLEGLAAVRELQIAAVRQDTLLIYLNSDADAARLVSVFALDNKLLPLEVAAPAGPVWEQSPQGTMDKPLQFRWARQDG